MTRCSPTSHAWAFSVLPLLLLPSESRQRVVMRACQRCPTADTLFFTGSAVALVERWQADVGANVCKARWNDAQELVRDPLAMALTPESESPTN